MLRSLEGGEALPAIEDVLQLPHVDPDVWRRFEQLFAELGESSDPAPEAREIRGAIGFALMSRALDAASGNERRRPGLVEEADHYFAHPEVAATVVQVYGIPSEFDFVKGTIHRVGTTSFIVKCPVGAYSSRLAAVKCVLYRYLFVPSITKGTESYKAAFGETTDHAPQVWLSTPRFIAMEFETGDTLAERLPTRDDRQKGVPPVGLTLASLDFLDRLAQALCDVLGQLQARDVLHLDLSTSNIIVRSPRDSESVDLALIDFGQNYLLSERVGSSDSFERAAVYVAPEVRGHIEPSWRSDAYSLGVILLEVASGRALSKEELLPALERLWIDAPGLARTLEDLLDEDPANRLLLLSNEELKAPFRSLGARLREEVRVIRSFVTRTGTTGRSATLRGWRLFRPLSELGAVREIANDLEQGADESYRHFGTLAKWSALSLFLWYVALVSFVYLTLADAGFYDLQAWAERLLDLTNARVEIGAFWDNLPGRLVPLTFALTAVTYYNNIFAAITTRAVHGWRARASEACMRSTTFGLYVAILWAMLWAPHAWPLCAGLGTMLVVLNNFFVWRLAVQARRAAQTAGFSTVTDESDRFVADFREWFALMAAYSLTMTLVGILLLTDVARDEAIYAYTVCFINVFKMYRLNCVQLAPRARAGVERVLATIRRFDALQSRAPAA